jgi:hypothetical protein
LGEGGSVNQRVASEQPEVVVDRNLGGVVWVCSNGCIDVAHKTEGNALDLCSVCKDGSCEPRATLGKRSKDQRLRDRELAETFPAFAESLKRPRRPPKPTVPSEITITRPGGEGEVVDGDALQPAPPQPAFDLTADQRRAILSPDQAPPRIAFSRQPPEDHPDEAPWPPSTVGDVVPVSGKVHIFVLGHSTKEDEIEVLYEVRDRRDPSGERLNGFKPHDPKVAPTTLNGQTQGEREPPSLPKAEATELANKVHLAELWDLRRRRDDLVQHHKDLANAPRQLRFHLEKTVDEIQKRIRYLERDTSS